MKKAIIFFLVFVAIQLAVGYTVSGVMTLLEGAPQEQNPVALIVTMAATSLATIAVFLYMKWVTVSRCYVQSRPWGVLCWCSLAAVGAIVPSMWLQEQMPELLNLVKDELDMILRNRWGYFVIGLLAPLAEEMVFRGAILRQLLESRFSPWTAIVLSALFFTLAHANPAQMPHAFLVGLLLGWMYWRTGSIVPAVAYHWVNNTIAYVVYNLYPDPDLKLVNVLGSEQYVLMAVAFSLCILLPALFQLNLRMRKTA